jgi:hypothetical protein
MRMSSSQMRSGGVIPSEIFIKRLEAGGGNSVEVYFKRMENVKRGKRFPGGSHDEENDA